MKSNFYDDESPQIKEFYKYFVDRQKGMLENVSEYCQKHQIEYTENKKEEFLTFINCIEIFDKMLKETNPEDVLKYAGLIGETLRYYFFYKNGWDAPREGFEGQCWKLSRKTKNEVYKSLFYLLAGVYTMRSKFFGPHLKKHGVRDYGAKMLLYNCLWFIVVFSKEEGISENVKNVIQNQIELLESYNSDAPVMIHKLTFDIDKIIYAVKNYQCKSAKDIQTYMKDCGCKKVISTKRINTYITHKEYKNLFTKKDSLIILSKGAGNDKYNTIRKKISELMS